MSTGVELLGGTAGVSPVADGNGICRTVGVGIGGPMGVDVITVAVLGGAIVPIPDASVAAGLGTEVDGMTLPSVVPGSSCVLLHAAKRATVATPQSWPQWAQAKSCCFSITVLERFAEPDSTWVEQDLHLGDDDTAFECGFGL
jgi:hypothetical protein